MVGGPFYSESQVREIKSRQDMATKNGAAFVLVYGGLRTGGIETLIVRMAHFLTRKGFLVVVCCGDGALLSALPSMAEVLIYSDSTDLRRKFANGTQSLSKATDVIIVSFDPISAARALFVELMLPARSIVSHLSGVFHPRAYFMTGERKDRIVLNHWVARAVGSPYLFFMNDECRDGHAQRWHADLDASPIVILPIDNAERSWNVKTDGPLRIVSVGRLVDFKAYNLGAPKLVSTLRQRGVDASWDIYGDGSFRERIAAEIEIHGVNDFVKLKGELPYREFSEVVAGYDVFIGLGTAALEAAMLGVPTICATDSQRELCYGYLHELPYGNVGEMQREPPNVKILTLIEKYAHADRVARTRLSELCRGAAMKYEMGGFINQLVTVHRVQPIAPSRIMKRLVAWIYFLATESSVARLLRRVVRGAS